MSAENKISRFADAQWKVALKRYMDAANCDSTTLGPPEKDNHFLRNRIEKAFLAGYNYRRDRSAPPHGKE